jgi:hypothetical protein
MTRRAAWSQSLSLAGHPGPADRLVRVLAGGVDDVDRHARHVGDHDRAIGGFPFHLRRPRIGVAFGAIIALGEQLRLQIGDDIAVFGVHQGQRAEFRAAAERSEHLVVVHHQRALVGHEVLEGVDAAPGDVLHLVEHLLAPPGDRHVERVVAIGAGRLVVPALQRLQQRLFGIGQAEIDHHRRAAGERGACAALEIVRRIGAHERHFEMHMRVDAPGHHIAAGRIQFLAARQVLPDPGDHAVFDLHIGLVGPVGGDDRAVLDDGGHMGSLLAWREGIEI